MKDYVNGLYSELTLSVELQGDTGEEEIEFESSLALFALLLP